MRLPTNNKQTANKYMSFDAINKIANVTFLITNPGPHCYALAKGLESDTFLTSYDQHDFKHLSNNEDGIDIADRTSFTDSHCYDMMCKAVDNNINYLVCDQQCGCELFFMAAECKEVQDLIKTGKLQMNVMILKTNIDDSVVYDYQQLRGISTECEFLPSLDNVKKSIEYAFELFQVGVARNIDMLQGLNIMSSSMPHWEANFKADKPLHLTDDTIKSIAIACGVFGHNEAFERQEPASRKDIAAMLNDEQNEYVKELVTKVNLNYGGMPKQIIMDNSLESEKVAKRLKQITRRMNAKQSMSGYKDETRDEQECSCIGCTMIKLKDEMKNKKKQSEMNTMNFPAGSSIADVMKKIIDGLK